ncbi:MAG TPA: branched-chain amino acid ABC transporter permease [Anaerolineae bacterium]|nr:branched-chain amino acid ABC transporter permease [Anaerolineae bacterium]
MTKARRYCLYGVLLVAILAGLLVLPLVIKNRYVMHILVITAMYAALALGYDLIVGHVGLLSLAHPTFFGVGGYLAAILSTRFGSPFLVNIMLGGAIAAGLAFVASIPFFRLAGISFAIGTLGFALIMQLVANNELWLTNGPMCVAQVPRPVLTLPPLVDWHVSSVIDYYYLILGILMLVIVLGWRLTTSRVGRTFMSIREDEVLASAAGVNPLKYKTFAFVVGALIAGMIGAFYVHYSTIICPAELAGPMTTTLLIILYLGGVGRMRGVILGAILFTFIPEFLRVAPQLRMVAYGTLLILTIVYMPEGLDGAITKQLRRLPFFAAGPRDDDGEAL